MSTIKLGDKVRCKVTGFKGVATARVEYINGCVQYAITPKSKDGVYPDSTYLDEKQIEAGDGDRVELKTEATGGPQRNAPSH